LTAGSATPDFGPTSSSIRRGSCRLALSRFDNGECFDERCEGIARPWRSRH
jgi:hypothetical protein